MMLSNRMTAKSLDANPAIQHISKTEKTIKEEIPTKLCFLFTFFALLDVSLMILDCSLYTPVNWIINALILT